MIIEFPVELDHPYNFDLSSVACIPTHCRINPPWTLQIDTKTATKRQMTTPFFLHKQIKKLTENSGALMSSLQFSTLPGSQHKREYLTFGYVRSKSLHNIPPEIISLCCSFYNETLQWTVDCHDLREFVKHNAKQLYVGEYFHCQGIKMRWVMNPAHSRYLNYLNVTSLHLQIPAVKTGSIANGKFFISIYCADNGASFERVIELDEGKLFLDANGMSAPFRMILDYDNLDTFTMVHHVDVLQAEFINNTDCVQKFSKPIKMSSTCSFEWQIEGILLKQMQTAVPAQMFYSDLFDGHNHNWALALFPQGQNAELPAKDHTFDLVLRLFKAPSTVKSVKVELTVNNSLDNKQIRRELEFENKCQWDEYCATDKVTVFASSRLTQMEQVGISVQVKVLTVSTK